MYSSFQHHGNQVETETSDKPAFLVIPGKRQPLPPRSPHSRRKEAYTQTVNTQSAKSYDGEVKKKYGLYTQTPQCEYQFCQLSALQCWVSHLTFLSFGSLLCSVEMITPSVMGCYEDYWAAEHLVPCQNSKWSLLLVAVVVTVVRSKCSSDRWCIRYSHSKDDRAVI